MASNLNIILSGAAWQVVDNTSSTTPVNFSLSNPTLGGSVESFIDYLPVAAGGGTVLTLPAATIWVLGIKNLGGINASPAGNITVQIQVTGGVLQTAANSPVIAPNGVFLYWQPTESANGIIAVTLVASIANTPVALIMGQ